MREIHSGRPWIGSNFDRKLSELTQEEFFVRPSPDMHSVAEIISHLTIWRKETILKIETGKGSITDHDPLNWQELSLLKEKGQDNLMREFRESLDELIHLLKDKEDSWMDQQYFDTDFDGYYPYSFVINGMLHHDLYHLGQIGLILRALRS